MCSIYIQVNFRIACKKNNMKNSCGEGGVRKFGVALPAKAKEEKVLVAVFPKNLRQFSSLRSIMTTHATHTGPIDISLPASSSFPQLCLDGYFPTSYADRSLPRGDRNHARRRTTPLTICDLFVSSDSIAKGYGRCRWGTDNRRRRNGRRNEREHAI